MQNVRSQIQITWPAICCNVEQAGSMTTTVVNATQELVQPVSKTTITLLLQQSITNPSTASIHSNVIDEV